MGDPRILQLFHEGNAVAKDLATQYYRKAKGEISSMTLEKNGLEAVEEQAAAHEQEKSNLLEKLQREKRNWSEEKAQFLESQKKGNREANQGGQRCCESG
jgi:hypothetical protein